MKKVQYFLVSQETIIFLYWPNLAFLGLPSGPIVRNSGLWKPDGRKGECGSSISPRANVNEVVKTVKDYYDKYLKVYHQIGNTDLGEEL